MSSKVKVTGRIATILAFIALIMWQQWRTRTMIAEANVLREQAGQVAALREENLRLTEQLRVAADRAQGDTSELARLRGQAVRMQELEKENTRLLSQRERLAKVAEPLPAQTREDGQEETPQRKFQRAKGFFGRDLGLAIIRAADANSGKMPTELRGPLFDTVEALSQGSEYDVRAKDFELIYSGSLNDVKEPSDTVLAREKQPVQLADGKWRRLYVMADGSSRFLAAEVPDGFNEREKELWPWRGMR